MEIKRGEIYLAQLGEGVGSEQKGERPVIVVQNNKGNKFSPTVSVIPITTKIHKSTGMPTHVLLGRISGLEEFSACMAEQIMTIDKTRLMKRIGKISEKFMKRDVDVALKTQLDLRGGRRHG